MSLGIRTRVFIVLLLATSTVAGGMYLFTHLAFEHGFVEYVRQQEERRIGAIAERLEAWYAERGTWGELRRNHRLWWRLLASSRAPEPPPGMEHDDDDEAHHRPPPPPDEAVPFALRIGLYDLDRSLVAGRPGIAADALEMRPLRAGTQVIGFIGFRPEQRLSDRLDRDFASTQTHGFVLIALLAVLMSALLALPLAHRFVRPLRELQGAARRLAGGDYDVRASVGGDDELGRLARDFNDMAHALGRTETQRRRWVADVSHELRTPLAILRGEIEALQDGIRPLSPAALASLHAETLYVGRLIDDLYDLSMSDIGALKYRKEMTDAIEPLRETLDGMRTNFARAGLTIDDRQLADDPVTLFADVDRLTQLYKNLFANSLRYTDSGGRVEVAAAQVGDALHIDVRDSAPGVAEVDLAHLFERFYRAEVSRSRDSGGAGLGLAICANIVAAHDGRIEARPSPLGGLWIHIELPLP